MTVDYLASGGCNLSSDVQIEKNKAFWKYMMMRNMMDLVS